MVIASLNKLNQRRFTMTVGGEETEEENWVVTGGGGGGGGS